MTKYIGGCAAVIALLGLTVWWEYSLWTECRSDHSFFYCMRVLNK